MTKTRWGIICSLGLASVACGSDEFSVAQGDEDEASSGGNESESGDGDAESGGSTSTGNSSSGDGDSGDGDGDPGDGDGDSGDGDGDPGDGDGDPGDGDDAPGDGDGDEVPPWSGDRSGPTLDEVDETLGNFGQDLPEPEPCPDLPERVCLRFTGLSNDAPISGSCTASTHAFAAGVLSCTGPDISFALAIESFTGPPPSKFALVAEAFQTPLAFSWEPSGFASHDAQEYLLKESHEQQLRISGVRYELALDDGARVPFVSAFFAVNWARRPTCPACPSLRLRGVLSAVLED